MPRRTRPRERQLDLEWTDTIGWSELPAEVREQLRIALRALLERAALPRAEGGPHE